MIKGAAKYAIGPRRSLFGQVNAASACATCPMLTTYFEDELAGLSWAGSKLFADGERPVSGWCGEPGDDKNGGCGCLVLAQCKADPIVTVTVRGMQVGMRAGGKTTKADQECPRGRWGAE